MLFVLPIILGAAAAGTGLLGVLKGAEGFGNLSKAEKIGKQAQQFHEIWVRNAESQWQTTNRLAEIYGKLQLRTRQRVVKRFIQFIERNGQRASQTEQQFLEGLEGISIEQLQDFKALVFEAEEILQGLGASTATGFAAGSCAVGAANAVGTIAVPQFFGLFAKNVAVSQLGLPGVALWMGGGNFVIGSAVLGGVTLGPALAVGGFQLAGKGEKALTQAKKYEAEVNVRIGQVKTAIELLKRIEIQIRETGTLVRKLESRASECLDKLESLDFDPIRDTKKFQQVALLVTAIIEISKTPILDDDGNINSSMIKIQAKYQILGDS